MPDNNKPLFWYPGLNNKFDFDMPIDQEAYCNVYIMYFLNRLQSMFKYEGLPDTIPQKYLENYLLVNGHCGVFMNGDKGLAVSNGSWSGIPDLYYVPKEYIIANPYVEDSARKPYTINEDIIVARNDTYCMGVMPMLCKFARALAINDSTMEIADVIARATLTITALNGRDKESVEEWLRNLRKGKLASIGTMPAMVGNQDNTVTIQPFQATASTLTDLIEYHQYLKAGLFNELGLNSNYNMKREAINSNESQLNDDALHPLIDDMLKMRKEFCDQVNEMFGTKISVEFNSAWAENEKENELMLSGMEAQTEALETSSGEAAPQNEDGLIDDTGKGEDDGTDEDMDGDRVPSGDSDRMDDDTSRSEPSTEEKEGTEEASEEPQDDTPAIEELTEAIEKLADAIENDAKEGEA